MNDSDPIVTLSKKLSYLLRHSSNQVPIYTRERWVPVDAILVLPGMKKYTRKDIELCVETSISSSTKKKRFQALVFQGQQYIRVETGSENIKPTQMFEEMVPLAPEPQENIIPSLFQLCITKITQNIKQFGDLSGIGDSFLLESLINELIRLNKLNNSNIKIFLVPELERLTLSGHSIIVEQSTLKKVANSCTELAFLKISDTLSLTDTLLTLIAKKCINLKSVELDNCRYITDQGLKNLAIHRATSLRSLTLNNMSGISLKGVQEVLKECLHLQTLTLTNCEQISSDHLDFLSKNSLIKLNFSLSSAHISDLWTKPLNEDEFTKKQKKE